MAIKIIKPTEPVDIKNLVVTIVSNPGLGKTTLGFTAKKPLLLDFDNGNYRAKNRQACVNIVRWHDISTLAIEDLADYDTVVIDVVGRALEILGTSLILAIPKMGKSDGTLSLQGFGALSASFRAFLAKLRSFGKDIVLLCHAKEEKSGDDNILRIDAQGSSKQEIFKCSDLMGTIEIINGKRTLSFNPTTTAMGKNCADIATQEIPHYETSATFLADIIEQAKNNINMKSKEMIETEEEYQSMIDLIDVIDTVDGLSEAKQYPLILTNGKLKMYLVEHAKKIGYSIKKNSKGVWDTDFTLIDEVKNAE
jgi:hypothetical protein